MKSKQTLLYSGLGLLLVALIVRWTGVSVICFWILFCAAIALKAFFLISVFREKGFKPKLWLYLILAGVVVIFVSMLFKSVFPMPVLYKILFYCAIILKMAGLGLMVFSEKRKN